MGAARTPAAESLNKPIFPILLEGRGWSELADIQYEDMTAGVRAVLSGRLVHKLEDVGVPRRRPAVAEAQKPVQTERRRQPAVPLLMIGAVGLFALTAVVIAVILIMIASQPSRDGDATGVGQQSTPTHTATDTPLPFATSIQASITPLPITVEILTVFVPPTATDILPTRFLSPTPTFLPTGLPPCVS